MNTADMPLNLLPDTYQDLARVIGLDAALTLGREYGGMSLYLPKLETATRPWRDKSIREEFTGANVSALARKYRLTSTRVRQILGAPKEK